MDNDTILFFIFLIAAFIGNEIVLKRKRYVEHRVYQTLVNRKDKESYLAEDHIWIQQGKVIKVITHDGIMWAKDLPGLVRVLAGGGAEND